MAAVDWLPASEYPFEHRFIEVESNRIHYVDEGAGAALLLVNVGEWSFIFRDLILRLRGSFRCVAPDFPGLGLSEAAPGYEPTIPNNSRILETFVDRLGLHDATLLVHDIGGPVGLGLAARRPELFRALVISETFAWPLREYPWIRRALRFVSGSLSRFVNVNFNLMFAASATSFGVGRHLSAEGRRAFLAPWRRHATRMMTLRNLGSALTADAWLDEVARAVDTTLNALPVLTVFGERSDPAHWQARYARAFSNVRSVTVPGGNHFPFADDPNLVADEVIRWWRETVAPKGAHSNRRSA